MKDIRTNILAAASIIFSCFIANAATSFSELTVAQVSQLLSQASASASQETVSAKDPVSEPMLSSQTVLLPVSVTAEDLVSKLYGVIDASVCKDECIKQSRELLRLTPEEDNGALWLETDTGYGVNYYGMFPDVTAMVRFLSDSGDSGVADYGYFFLFPYDTATKQESIRQQADFCGSLLQEMADVGLQMDLNTVTDDLFEAVGDYRGALVDVRLLDEKNDTEGGRYILILSVEPNAFVLADN